MHMGNTEAPHIGAGAGTRAIRRASLVTLAILLAVTALTASVPDRALGLPDPPLGGEETAQDPETPGGVSRTEYETSGSPAEDPGGDPYTGADLEVLYMMGWAGYGTSVHVIPVVRNNGPAASSGHSLVFAPEAGTERTVTAPSGCAAEGAGFRCVGGALQPGEATQYHFVFSLPPDGPEAWPPFWIAEVAGEEPDPDSGNDRDRFELPDSTHVLVEADIKTRVEDADGDGRATPGERMEVYVYFVNDSEYELQDVLVEVSGTVNDHRRLPQTIGPGTETTVRFDATVPDLGPGAASGASASVTAGAVGGSVSTWTGTLMLLGPYASPNPDGPLGPQPEPTKNDPLAGTVVDLEEELAARKKFEECQRLEEERASAAEAVQPERSIDASAPERVVEEPATATAAAGVPDSPRSGGTVSAWPAQSGSEAREETGRLAVAGIGALRAPIIVASGLIGLGVILAQIGLSRHLVARRARYE